ELLDPLTGKPITQAPDGEITPVSTPTDNSGGDVPSIALAPVEPDSDIAGIGLGTTQQFNADGLQLNRSALRDTAATAAPPSGIVLVIGLLIAPAVLLGAGFVFVRRRHSAVF
ncbi:MAG TPA: hypothetical protein VHD87_05605, partial [Acidimicrobiales bacterium]|nr:hypothetical protein [Acidimicrobiales bacterium]